MGRVPGDKRRAAIERLQQLRADDALTVAHVRTVAEGLDVTERTVWRWLAPPRAETGTPAPRPHYELSDTDREAFAFYRGNIAAVARARHAVTADDGTTAGAPVPDFLAEGWAKARSVTERTLQRAFTTELTPAERAVGRPARPDAARPRCTCAARTRCAAGPGRWTTSNCPSSCCPRRGRRSRRG